MDPVSKSAIVIDNGSGYMKYGFSGNDNQPQKLPSIVGRQKYNVVDPKTNNQSQAYVGKDLNDKKMNLYKLKYPMKRGVVQDWQEMELIWKYCYSQLKVSSNDHPVLLTDANMNPIKHRRQMYEIFFEKFQVPAAHIAVQGVLSLFATGKSTGIVLDSGDGVTHAIPVYQGFSLAHSCERIDFGGRDVTIHLRNLLKKNGVNMDTSSQFELIKDMKQKYCIINQSTTEQLKQKIDQYKLPDGQTVQLTNNQKQAGQFLFSPQKIGLQYPSISELVANSLSKVDLNLRVSLYNQIVLSGGNTMFQGFPQRFSKQIKKVLPSDTKSRILATPTRDTMCWAGGSILAGLSSFKSMLVTKAEYYEGLRDEKTL